MKLLQILSQIKIPFRAASNLDNIEFNDIALDSRLAKQGTIFFALQGKNQDGSKFIEDAIKNGAVAVVSSVEVDISAPLILCDNPFLLLVEFLKIFYSPLPTNIYAVTGTNGKTSTAEFTRQILEFFGKKSASIGTLGIATSYDYGESLQNSGLTTPDIVSFYKNLAILKQNKIDDVVLEASSIGLEQKRIAGINIAVGAFTNFTQDHLDYHGKMDQYFEAKMMLFEDVLKDGSKAVLNSDIDEFEKIVKICQKKDHQILSYGYNAGDFKICKINQSDFGQEVFFEFRHKIYLAKLKITGEFQAFNMLCALAIVMAQYNLSHLQLEKLLSNFSQLNSALGRMQKVVTLKNKAQIFIDFAHTPDALENVLNLGRKLTHKRLVILFGCGGNRDAKKRPIMGKIASDLADLVIVTDDNPRHEDSKVIRAEIISACDEKKTIEIDDRKIAIEKAISMLESEDVLILAGKGHEKYQIIGDKKSEFDEEKIVKNVAAKFI